MDKSEDEQTGRFDAAPGQSLDSGGGDTDESDSRPTQDVSDAVSDINDVASSWTHQKKISPSPVLKDFLLSLKAGIENMISMEKERLDQYVQAKNKMGGR